MHNETVAWINVVVLFVSTIGFVWVYVLSAGPAALEKKIGESAYKRCTFYRFASGLFIVVILVCYGMYFFYPLPGIPQWFPWPWWLTLAGCAVVSLPFFWIWFLGVKDAGRESMIPDKRHTLNSGIYLHIRHPQAVGEHAVWVLIGVATHSPFLALYSLIWIPAAVVMSMAEERDLIIRYGAPYEEYRARTGAFLPKSWFGSQGK